MATTKASQRAVNKYIKNHYTRISYTAPRDFGEKIRAAAEAEGLAVNALITKALKEYLHVDGV